MVKSRGGEKITLEDFLGLCINAQFLDNRAIGYGLSTFFEEYKRGKDPTYKNGPNVEQNYENKLSSYSAQFGPFRKPVVEMYIECSHERVSAAGETDILQTLAYSAADSKTIDIKDTNDKATKRIMRIHVYDKQTNAYKEASRLFKGTTATGHDGFFSEPSTDFGKTNLSPKTNVVKAVSNFATIAINKLGIPSFTEFTNSQQAKELIAQMIPIIRFGANGSTITSANLSSKAEPLLSAVQMIRTQTIKNTASPNGAGMAGIPLRVIPAQLTMASLGNPLATAAQKYFIDFQTGTTLDNLYILTHYNHSFSPGKFETNWTFGFADGYGIFEGAQETVKKLGSIDPKVPKSNG
jgi:hypothetical protein